MKVRNWSFGIATWGGTVIGASGSDQASHFAGGRGRRRVISREDKIRDGIVGFP